MQRGDRRRVHRDARPARNVVKNHRQPDLADLLEVRQQPPLVRLVVVRVHDERGVRPGPGRLLCQAHRLGGRVGPKLDLTPS